MKKYVFVLSVIAICISAITSGTVAFFTDEEEAHNIITTGSIAVSIEEWTLKDGVLEPYPESEIEVMPGETVSKIVTVTNEDNDAYVRARYDVILKDSDGNIIDIPSEELEKLVLIVPDEEKWEKRSPHDGWYYYKGALPEDETTLPLFESVGFSGTEIKNEYQNSKIEVKVYAQAVQAINNTDSALLAVGWPEE